MLVCKLCPTVTNTESETGFLSEEELKKHMGTHSEFFVKKWRQFSQLQCRVCEMVVSEDSIENHKDSAHPANLFADIEDLVKDNIPGNNEDQGDQKLPVENKANLSTRKDIVTEDNPGEKTKDSISSLEQLKLWKTSRSNIIESNQENKFFQPETEFECLNPRMIPPNPKLRLKPLALLLDQSKIQTNIDKASDYEQENGPFPPEFVKILVNPCHLIMQGIKKNVSVENIKNFFTEKDIGVVKVSIKDGSGFVIFKNVKDAAAWNGKVIEIGDCCINIGRGFDSGGGENELRMSGISKTFNIDDLYDFFWKKLCVIDDISLLLNGTGKITFRLREDAAAWDGKLIAMKETQIRLWKLDSKHKRNLEIERIRSKEEGSRKSLRRDECWRSRSTASKDGRSSESKKGNRSRSREDYKRYKGRCKENRERQGSRSTEDRDRERIKASRMLHERNCKRFKRPGSGARQLEDEYYR